MFTVRRFRQAIAPQRLRRVAALAAISVTLLGCVLGLHNEARAQRLVPITLPDAQVLDENGRQVRFYTDLVRGKIVLINFVYTRCATICRPFGRRIAPLQQLLGDRLGRDVFLITVSLDPEYDTPERLRAWGAQFGAQPGWKFVTGSRAEINRVLNACGVSIVPRVPHSSTVLVGNDVRRQWLREYAFASNQRFLAQIDRVSR
jgi:cytochrome oxidase Cu insertion factor (SCO1/SenC/PrrC family)